MLRKSILPLLALGLLAVAPAAHAQDVAAGQRVFNQCRACHIIENNGRNAVGPNLNGVVGRKAGSIENFRYSASMKEKAEGGLVWTEDNLRTYLTNPKQLVPAGSMSFPGLKQPQQIEDVIAYIKSQAA